MAQPAAKLATWEDLWTLPEGVRAEIIDGVIEAMPSPSYDHQDLVIEIIQPLREKFLHGRDGPGGWWIIADVDVALAAHQVVRPDLAGWRKVRVPNRPTRPVRAVPDWALEVVSSRGSRRDRVTKMELYRSHGVPHYWLADPVGRVLEAYHLGERVVRLGAWTNETEARIPPFDAVALDVAAMFAVLGPESPESSADEG